MTRDGERGGQRGGQHKHGASATNLPARTGPPGVHGRQRHVCSMESRGSRGSQGWKPHSVPNSLEPLLPQLSLCPEGKCVMSSTSPQQVSGPLWASVASSENNSTYYACLYVYQNLCLSYICICLYLVCICLCANMSIICVCTVYLLYTCVCIFAV